MNQYLIVLHAEPTAFQNLSPQQMQEIYGRYRAWGQKLRDSKRYVGSNKLVDGDGRVLRANGQPGKVQITDGPYTESKEVLAGYYMFEAESYDEAIKICNDCPHLQFGTVEVREIQRM